MFDENNKNVQENTLHNTVPTDGFESSVSGVEPITKKKNGKKIAIISSASAAVIVGGSIAAYSFSPLVKNQVKLRTMEPDKYYAWVNETNAETFADSVSKKYEKALKDYKSGTKLSVSLDYEPTDDAKEYFLKETIGDDYKNSDDEEDQILRDIVNKADSIGVSVGSANKKTDLVYSAAVLFNGDKLVSTDIALDLDSLDAFMRIPELTDRWLGISLSSFIDNEELDEEETAVVNAYKEFLKDPEKFLTTAELKKEIIRYTNVWNESVGDIDLKKSEEIEIGDISVKYTVATVEIDRDHAKKIAENFIDELRDDKIIKGIVIDKLAIADEKEYNEALDEMLEDINDDTDYDDDDDLDDDRPAKKDEPDSITFSTYIDAKGVVRGCKFEAGEESCSYIIGQKGKDVRGTLSIDADGEKISADLSAEEVSKDVYDGSIDITYDDYDYNRKTKKFETIEKTAKLEFDGFEIVDKDNCTINADIKFTADELDAPISLSFKGKKNVQTIEYNLVLKDINYGKFTLTVDRSDKADIEMPDKDDACMIDPEYFRNFKIENYVSRDETEKFFYDVLIKVGVDEKTAKQYSKEAADNIFAATNNCQNFKTGGIILTGGTESGAA